MNRKTGIKIALVILLLAMAGISFGPCLKDMSVLTIGTAKVGNIYSGYCNYLPQFFCVVSLIELILVFIANKKWPKVVGIILTLIKLAFPMVYYGVKVSSKEVGDLVLNSPDFLIFPPTILGYALFALGLAAIILYVIDMSGE